MAGAYAKIESHEELCANRYDGIKTAIAELKAIVLWILGGVAACVLGVLGWALIQLYTLEPIRERSVPQVTVTAVAPAGDGVNTSRSVH